MCSVQHPPPARSERLEKARRARPARELARLSLAVAMCLLAACDPKPEPGAGSESHFLESCDASCGEGLSCLCGVCTKTCASAANCAALAGGVACVPFASRGVATSCADATTPSVCDVACTLTSDCDALGPAFFCEGGYCRSDPLYRAGEPLRGFGALCEQSGIDCSTAQTPPDITGTYTGTGTVVLSSNALWNVGNSEAVSAQITASGANLSGSFMLQSFALDVSGALIHGEGSGFSIYANQFVLVDGCNAEARAVISGVLDASAAPATVQGTLALRFTGNFATGCSAQQIASYPATGANFQHAETRMP